MPKPNTLSTRARHGRRPPVGQLAVIATDDRTALMASAERATRATMHLTMTPASIPAEVAERLRRTEGDRAALLAAAELPMGEIPWHGTLMFTDQDTADFRHFPLSGGSFRDLPLPLLANLETTEWGHVGAQLVGRIETLTMGAAVTATGFLADPTVDEDAFDVAYHLANGNIRGVSVDLEVPSMDWEPIGWDEDGYPNLYRMTALEWAIMGATITPFPAFPGAFVALDVPGAPAPAPANDTPAEPGVEAPELPPVEGEAAVGMTAAASGDTALPFAALATEWDEAGAYERLVPSFTDEAGGLDEAAASTAFLWLDESAEGVERLRLPFCDVATETGELLVVPAGVSAQAEALNAGIDGMPDDENQAIRARCDELFARMADEFGADAPTAPWAAADDDNEEEPLPEPVTASAATTRPRGAALSVEFPDAAPAHWFDDPGFDEAMPPVYEGTGRCYGHLALWDVCHIGFEDACVCAPHSALDYALFHTGYHECADGTQVRVGQLTMGTGHADRFASATSAAAHYDNTGTAFADVHVGEDAHGIWFAGRLRRITDEQLAVVRASALSGDWRGVNGTLELVASLAVNVPGFPVYRGLTAAGVNPVPDLSPRLTMRDHSAVSLIASAGAAKLGRLVSRRHAQASLADLDLLTERIGTLEQTVTRQARVLAELEPMARKAALARLGR